MFFDKTDNIIGNMNQTNRFWKFVFATIFVTLVVTVGILFLFYGSLNEEQVMAVMSIEKGHPIYLFIIFTHLG